MAAPVYSAGTFGNVVSNVSVAHGTVIGAFVNVPTDVECQLSCFVLPGATQPTVITVFSAYKVVAAYPIPITAVGSGTLTIGSTPATVGLFAKMEIGIQQVGGSKLGEIATITSITGDVLTVPTIVSGGYSIGDSIYSIEQTPSFTVPPASPTFVYAPSTPESAALFLPPAPWFIGVNNADTLQAIAVYMTSDLIIAIS
jgi:hypothetical protein